MRGIKGGSVGDCKERERLKGRGKDCERKRKLRAVREREMGKG